MTAKRKGTVSSPQMWRKQGATGGNAARLDMRKKEIPVVNVRIVIVKLPRILLKTTVEVICHY